MKTILDDRVLWFDGESTYNEEQILRCMFLGVDLSQIRVEEKTPNIIQFENQQPISFELKHENKEFDCSYPQEILDIDYMDYISECFMEMKHSPNTINDKIRRIDYEIKCYKHLKKENFLRSIIHIIKKFKKDNVVWNGRGSSSASYVLYVIGAHFIDSFVYNIDPYEFFKVSL